MSEAPHIDSDTARRWLGQMLLIRRFEEKSAELYSAGKIRGFLHLYVGEEAVAVGAISALNGEDAIVSHYREHGHALARGVPARAVMAEMFAKVDGCSRGRGGSMHLFDAKRRFLGGHAIVGSALPFAVGVALGDVTCGRRGITCCFFGDGAVAEGAFHEALNLASLWRLPVLFLCENNLYAMGTALKRYQSQPDLTLRASACGVPGESVDGMDVEGVAEATTRAARLIRMGEGPRFLECRTYRFRAHSMFDPELYREKSEVERWKQRDPIAAFVGRATARGLLPSDALVHAEREVAAVIEDAVQFAEASPLEQVEDLLRFVQTEQSTESSPPSLPRDERSQEQLPQEAQP